MSVPPEMDNEPPPVTGEAEYYETAEVIPFKAANKRTKKEAPPRPDWASQWQLSEKGSPLGNLYNALVTLRTNPQLHGILHYDMLSCAPALVGQIPNAVRMKLPTFVSNEHITAIQEEIQRLGLTHMSRENVENAVNLVSCDQEYHPVLNELHAFRWDGVRRMDTAFAHYFGANPPLDVSDAEKSRIFKYNSKIGRLFLISMIARVMQPGCKVDYMVVLEGPQGARKSSACGILAGKWFSDSLPSLAHGDMVRVSMHLRGKWLIEVAELSSFSKVETAALKDFISRREEQYIAKYARRESREPRQCVLVGTTNESVYLKDATGARRFWPVRCGLIDLEALKADRDQLLAEAYVAYVQGEQWWPDPAFEREVIKPEQDARFDEDLWAAPITKYLHESGVKQITSAQLLDRALFLTVDKVGTREGKRISDIMQSLKWLTHRATSGRYWLAPGHKFNT